jgi:hypothetical protein
LFAGFPAALDEFDERFVCCCCECCGSFLAATTPTASNAALNILPSLLLWCRRSLRRLAPLDFHGAFHNLFAVAKFPGKVAGLRRLDSCRWVFAAEQVRTAPAWLWGLGCRC